MRIRSLGTPVAVIAVGLAVVSATGIASAATGGNFLLGKSNSANRPTVLTNTGTGPALTLHAHNNTTAPLSVGTNRTKIGNLNSDFLDGLTSSQFQRRVSGTCAAGTSVTAITAGGGVTCAGAPGGYGVLDYLSGGQSLTNYPGITAASTGVLGAGNYLVTGTAMMSAGDSSGSYCYLQNGSTAESVIVGSSTTGYSPAAVTQVLSVTGGNTVSLLCYRDGSASTTLFDASITAIRVSSVSGSAPSIASSSNPGSMRSPSAR
jgi:hypothetical protein